MVLVSRVKSTPSPVGGWDTISSLADMPEDRASVLDNWFPGVGRCTVRKGYSEYATGLGGDVETLAEFISGSVRTFLGFANNKVWNISSAGAASDITNGMTITMNRWQWACMDGKMGLVNGTDAPLEVATDGTTVSTMTLSGPTIANVIGINVFGSRSYFWEDDSQSFWYSATNALGGACTEFPLGRIGNLGGKLLTMGTWTRDAGDGMDDLAAFFMTSGQVVVYSGADPASYVLVGIFNIGAPVSIRGVIKLAGDLVVITKDGYESLEGVINKGRLGNKGILSNQINSAVSDAVKESGTYWGWEAFHYPKSNMLIFNVPVTTNTTYNQHVFNTNTGKPCRFKNINSRTWGLYNDSAYFGGSGSVFLFEDGFDDNGAVIDADSITANNYLGSESVQKLITGVKPIMISDGAIAIAVKTEADFKTPVVEYATVTFEGGSSDWDTAEWDIAEWAGDGTMVTDNWIGEGAFGFSFQSRVRVRTKGQVVKWPSFLYMYEPAGLV